MSQQKRVCRTVITSRGHRGREASGKPPALSQSSGATRLQRDSQWLRHPAQSRAMPSQPSGLPQNDTTTVTGAILRLFPPREQRGSIFKRIRACFKEAVSHSRFARKGVIPSHGSCIGKDRPKRWFDPWFSKRTSCLHPRTLRPKSRPSNVALIANLTWTAPWHPMPEYRLPKPNTRVRFRPLPVYSRCNPKQTRGLLWARKFTGRHSQTLKTPSSCVHNNRSFPAGGLGCWQGHWAAEFAGHFHPKMRGRVCLGAKFEWPR